MPRKGEILTLSGSNEMLGKLNYEQKDVDYALAKLRELMDASIIVRSPERDEHGRIKYVSVPNVGIQLAAATKFLEFTTGKPRQSIEMTDNTSKGSSPTGLNDLARLLHKNPDVTARVLGALRDGVKLAEAITVEAVTTDSPYLPTDSQSGGSPSKT